MDPELKAALDELNRSYGAAVDMNKADIATILERMDAIELGNQRIRTDAITPARAAFSAYLRHGRDGIDDDLRANLVVSDDTAGGYITAPDTFMTEIVKNLVEFSPIRQFATVTTISTSGVKLPRQTTRPAAYWVEEVEDRTETNLAYGQLSIPMHEAATFVDVSQQLLEDAAVNVEAEVGSELAIAFAKLEADAHLTGDGVKKPKGILSDDSVTDVATGTAATITADSLIDLYHAVPSMYAKRGTWLANRNTLASIRKLKSGDGAYLWQDSLQASTPPTLLGRPIVEDPDMPEIGAGLRPLMFGDISNYRIFDRVNLSLLRDPYTQAGNGLVRIRARRRTGGAVVRGEAIRTLKCVVSL